MTWEIFLKIHKLALRVSGLHLASKAQLSLISGQCLQPFFRKEKKKKPVLDVHGEESCLLPVLHFNAFLRTGSKGSWRQEHRRQAGLGPCRPPLCS